MNDINHDNTLQSLMVADEPKGWELMHHHQKVTALHSAVKKYFGLSEEAICLTYNVIYDLQPGSWRSNVEAVFPALEAYVTWNVKIRSGQLQYPTF